jgi:peroxiredoxin
MKCKYVRTFVALAVLFLTGSAGLAAQAAGEKPTRRDNLDVITADYEKRLTDFRKARTEATTDAENEAAEKLRPSLNEFGKRFLTLAEEQPADEVACDALLWIADNCGQQEMMQLESAYDLIEKHHLNSPKLKNATVSLATATSERANALAVTIAEKAGDREVRAFAAYFVGYGIYCQTGGVAEKDLARIEQWMNRVQTDYADIKFENRTLGEMAKAQVFELRNLIPGKVAPEIEGIDVDGQKLKLSEHRGKVVLLVFWGSWCGPCMGEVPHLRALTDTHFRRPFTVFGVNSGDTKDQAAKAVKEEKMTWPILFDGEYGPVVQKWNVTGFPTIYIIDATGVIRFKHAIDEEPDAIIERLVREAERNR